MTHYNTAKELLVQQRYGARGEYFEGIARIGLVYYFRFAFLCIYIF